jgi:hypothetical protein
LIGAATAAPIIAVLAGLVSSQFLREAFAYRSTTVAAPEAGRMRRKLQASLTVLALVLAGAAQASAAEAATPQPCTLKGNPHTQNDEWASCLQVEAVMDKAPAVGETAPITFTITAQQAQKDVKIEADLPGNLKWVNVPADMSTESVKTGSRYDGGTLNRAVGTKSLAAGSKTTFTGSVTATGAGATQIRVRAKYPVPGGVDAAEDSVFLTIGDKASAFGIESRALLDTAPIDRTPVQSQVPPEKRRVVEVKPAAPKGIGVQSTSCVTGGWFFQDSTGAVKPSINMTVEAWEGGTLLSAGFTGWDGRYSLCFGNVPSGRNVYVRFITANPLWRVRDVATGNDFVFPTWTQFVADGAGVDFGNLFPRDPAYDRGLWAFDSANAAWAWKPGYCWDALDTTCTQLTINWSPSSTAGTCYCGGQVWLSAADPDAPITVVHEIGHFVMHDVYDGAFPPAPNCWPHWIEIWSSEGCAWVEGFADWFPTQVFNTPYFRWPDGSSLNMETPTWDTPLWGTTDAVEGRVAGALIDISDFTNDGPYDGYGEGPFGIWNTFLNHYSINFAQFWSQRAGDGYDVSDGGALSCVFQNTIDYGFRDPLADYTELTRPTPAPSHNYRYDTRTRYWSAVAVRPPAGADYDLELYEDRAQTAFLKGSYYGGNNVEFIAVDSGRRPLEDYYPRVPQWSGRGDYQIELAQGADILWTAPQTITMSATDVVVVRDVFLWAGVPTTITVAPGAASQDAELYLMQSDATAASWIKSRGQATASSLLGGPGATEQISFTPTVSDWYGLVLINKAGSGNYTLSKV